MNRIVVDIWSALPCFRVRSNPALNSTRLCILLYLSEFCQLWVQMKCRHIYHCSVAYAINIVKMWSSLLLYKNECLLRVLTETTDAFRKTVCWCMHTFHTLLNAKHNVLNSSTDFLKSNIENQWHSYWNKESNSSETLGDWG